VIVYQNETEFFVSGLVYVAGLLVLFHLAYVWAIFRKDFSVIDVFWGPSLAWAGLCGFLFAVGSGMSETVSVLGLGSLALLLAWALRLSGYIALRARRLGKEDARYANWRAQWGRRAISIAYVRVFLLQAAISLWIGAPVFVAFRSKLGREETSLIEIVGLLAMLIGFVYESVADFQKSAFKAKPEHKDRMLTSGLWKYSRHPNYFGEIVFWWGVSLSLFPQVAWWGLLPGLTINLLLLKVSGITLLEARYSARPEFAEYRRRTRALLPWWPRE